MRLFWATDVPLQYHYSTTTVPIKGHSIALNVLNEPLHWISRNDIGH